MEVRFREGRPEDVRALVRRAAETAWHSLPPWAQAHHTPEQVARHVQELMAALLRDGEGLLIVAEGPAGQNVGHVWLGLVRNSYTGARRGHIYDLYVAPAWRGRGLGRRLLAEAERLSREMGCVELGLTVAADNAPARRLYEVAGFRVEHLIMGKRL